MQGKLLRSDVVIVGAGPGGSAAAYWLAAAGADVLLVDKEHFPRSKPCGDGLTPRAVRMLEEMGMGDFLHHKGYVFRGIRLYAPDGHISEVKLSADTGTTHGIVLPRIDLDDALRSRAVEVGARFLPGFHVVSPHRVSRKVAGVAGRWDGCPLILSAKLVILATGAIRAPLQAFGFPDNVLLPTGLAWRGYATGVQGLDEYLEIHLFQDILPGYAWVFPTGQGTANIGVGIKLNGMNPNQGSRALKSAFQRFLQSGRLKGAGLSGRPRGFPLLSAFPYLPTYAPGVLVVGEAAGLVDPFTGEGIALALESGRMAAQAAAEALRANDFCGKFLRRYDKRLRTLYERYFEDAHELIARVGHPEALESIVGRATCDPRVGEAFSAAILDGEPRRGIELLGYVLKSPYVRPIARAIFTLGAYRPLLDKCRTYMLEQVSIDTPHPYLLQMLRKGKMLRPLLVFLGYRAAGGDPMNALQAAAGIELVHVASLVHDDIMDNAYTRRGIPALHRVLGVQRAIVCGDYLIAKAFRLLAESRTLNPADRVVKAFIVGADSGIQTCAGQFLDVGEWRNGIPDEAEYSSLIADKTASALSGALVAGCALAGGNNGLSGQLALFGQRVGRAFQIRDDVLDFENPSGRDCRVDRRVSLPLIHAFREGDDVTRAGIRLFLAGGEISCAHMTSILRANSSLRYAQQVATSLSEEAAKVAESIPGVSETLKALAIYSVLRER